MSPSLPSPPPHAAANRGFLLLAFFLGLAAVAWVGAGFVRSGGGIALAMTLAIGGVYLLGAQEVRRWRAATADLSAALARVPQPLERLGDWLAQVPPAWRDAVRRRVEEERGGLPGLALTPYLIGLLVMLGMLGTFLGLVVTFQGVVFTLEGSADLQAIRSALADPIRGLGLAFGTSVAGVATSAMLGLMAAISRRERAGVVRRLDALIATDLRPFSLAHQRQQTFDALQRQASALPAVAERLQALMEQMERRGQQLDEQLLARQDRFHAEATAAYGGLAASVEQSLRDTLGASARAAGESLRPVVETAMTAIAQETAQQHERVNGAVQAHLNGLAERFAATTGRVADTWASALQAHARAGETQAQGLEQALAAFTSLFEQRSAALVAQVQDTVSRAHAQHSAASQQQGAQWAQSLQDALATLQAEWRQAGAQTLARQQAVFDALEQAATRWRDDLATLRSEDSARGEAAMQRLGELQASLNAQVATHLGTLGQALEAPVQRLLDNAAEAPRAAAALIGELRRDMSQLNERDNAALQERAELMGQIDALLQSVRQATGEQRAAIETLVGSATAVLDQVGRQFADTVGAQAVSAEAVAAQVGGSAIELASLGEAFGHGVERFGATSEKLIDSLQRIEAAVGQSMARSDEQLAYYVAQAREVIDLSITSQHGILEDLRRLRQAEAPGRAQQGQGRRTAA